MVFPFSNRVLSKEQQRDDVAAMGTEILSLEHEANVTMIKSFLTCFPEIAEDLGCGAQQVLDKFEDKGWYKAALSVGKEFNLSIKMEDLKRKMNLQSIEVAAKTEGKEIPAVQMCWRTPRLRARLVRTLLKVGKLALARELIFAYNLKLTPTSVDVRRGKERAQKFFQLLGRDKGFCRTKMDKSTGGFFNFLTSHLSSSVHFRLPKKVKVQMISSPKMLDGLTRTLSWTCVGLDTESTFNGRTALLQVATESEAFLIDTLAINREEVQNFLAAQLNGVPCHYRPQSFGIGRFATGHLLHA